MATRALVPGLLLSSILGACSGGPRNDVEGNTEALSAAACGVVYETQSQWDTGFVASVRFTNPGPPLQSWKVEWEYTGGQRVQSSWNGRAVQQGSTVTVSNDGWNGYLGTGATASFGLTGVHQGQNPKPTSFKVNGVACGKPDTPPDAGTPPPPPPDGGGGPPQPPPAGKVVVAYFTAWSVYGRGYHVSNIPADKITHINYAFANINDAGECVLGDPYADVDKAYPGDSWDNGALRGSFHQLKKLKEKNKNLKTLISVGGWTWSGRFSDVAATPAAREKFATSCADFMNKYGFDGIDIDWEYPVGGGLPSNKYRPEDKQNYTLLLQALRSKIGNDHLLTIAAPAGPSIIANMDIAPIGRVLDWINVMTYDFHGGWEAQANFNAPLYPMKGDTSKFTVSEAMDAYIAGGVPAQKLVMGVPFYGRGWAGVGATNDGLLQASTGLPTGSWEPGVFDYKDLAANYVGKNGYVRHWNDDAKVPWLYSPQTQVMISYDDAESMGIKAEYIKNKGFGGAMFWELSGDNGTLLDSLNAKMR